MTDCPITLVRSEPTELWEVQLPWTRPPLSMNDRRHWRGQAKAVAQVRQDVGSVLRSQRMPKLNRVRVCLHYRPRDRRVRDSENPVSTLKAICDEIVAVGIVRDDRPEFMEKLMPVIHPCEAGLKPAVWLTIEALPAVEDDPEREAV